MNEASFASLNPTLLARKGGAKPAMRPQLHSLPNSIEADDVDAARLEDLGWNDMGVEPELPSSKGAEVLHLTPAVAHEDFEADDHIENPQSEEYLSEEAEKTVQPEPIEAQPEPVEAQAEPAEAKAKPAKATGRRAAFTLRLDTDRHLKLRLAATMQGKSAQALVTEALDHAFAQIQDLDALAERMNRT